MRFDKVIPIVVATTVMTNALCIHCVTVSDVNKDRTHKDKDKDQAFKDNDKDKDFTYKDKDLTHKGKDKDKDLKSVLEESLRTRTRINIAGYSTRFSSKFAHNNNSCQTGY